MNEWMNEWNNIKTRFSGQFLCVIHVQPMYWWLSAKQNMVFGRILRTRCTTLANHFERKTHIFEKQEQQQHNPCTMFLHWFRARWVCLCTVCMILFLFFFVDFVSRSNARALALVILIRFSLLLFFFFTSYSLDFFALPLFLCTAWNVGHIGFVS